MLTKISTIFVNNSILILVIGSLLAFPIVITGFVEAWPLMAAGGLMLIILILSHLKVRVDINKDEFGHLSAGRAILVALINFWLFFLLLMVVPLVLIVLEKLTR